MSNGSIPSANSVAFIILVNPSCPRILCHFPYILSWVLMEWGFVTVLGPGIGYNSFDNQMLCTKLMFFCSMWQHSKVSVDMKSTSKCRTNSESAINFPLKLGACLQRMVSCRPPTSNMTFTFPIMSDNPSQVCTCVRRISLYVEKTELSQTKFLFALHSNHVLSDWLADMIDLKEISLDKKPAGQCWLTWLWLLWQWLCWFVWYWLLFPDMIFPFLLLCPPPRTR